MTCFHENLCVPSCDNLFLVGVYLKANKVQSRATFQEHELESNVIFVVASDHTSRTGTRRGRR